MSYSLQKLQPVLLTDPITNVADVSSYAVVSSGNQLTWKVFSSTSINPGQINFTCTPPSANVIVDRNVTLGVPIRLTLTGTVFTTDNAFQPPTSLLNVGKDAPRAFPASSAMQNLGATLNGYGFNQPLNEILHPLTHLNTDTVVKNTTYSTTPSMLDQSQNYNDLFGTNRNPLGSYGDSLPGAEVPRGGFPFTIVSNPAVVPTVAGTAATAVVDFFVNEQLYLSPFFFGDPRNDSQGFYNLTSMDFAFQFLSGAWARMWSHNNHVASSGAIEVTSIITAGSHQFSGFSPAFSYPANATPSLQLQYITPNLLDRQKIGPNDPVTYPFNKVDYYVTAESALAFGSSRTITTSNVQLNSIPRRFIVFARPANSVLNTRCDLTDSYYTINSCTVNWAAAPTMLSGASQQQLYAIAVRNGYMGNFISWAGLPINNSALPPSANAATFSGSGSILPIDLGTQISLEPGESPGVSGKYQVQISVNITNNNQSGDWDALPISLYLLSIMEGTMTIQGVGSCDSQLGVLSSMDVINAQELPGISYLQVQDVSGGSFLSSLQNFGSKINDFLKRTKLLSTLTGLASQIPDKRIQSLAVPANLLAHQFGYGADQYGPYDQQGGFALRNKGAPSGGMALSKSQMRKRL